MENCFADLDETPFAVRDTRTRVHPFVDGPAMEAHLSSLTHDAVLADIFTPLPAICHPPPAVPLEQTDPAGAIHPSVPSLLAAVQRHEETLRSISNLLDFGSMNKGVEIYDALAQTRMPRGPVHMEELRARALADVSMSPIHMTFFREHAIPREDWYTLHPGRGVVARFGLDNLEQRRQLQAYRRRYAYSARIASESYTATIRAALDIVARDISALCAALVYSIAPDDVESCVDFSRVDQ
jgi:hypothetical protein